MMKNLFRKLIAVMLVALTLVPMFATAAEAASSWPTLSSSKYLEFKATEKISVYRNSACTTRGTSSPAKSYNAYISKNDVCKILKVTSSYVQLQYPTSSGYKTGYVKRTALFSVSAPSTTVTSQGRATVYAGPGYTSYGTVVKGDKVYVCGTSGSYTRVIYEAKSGSRAWKMGYVSTSTFNSTINPAPKPSNNTASTVTSWQWPVSSYRVSQSFNNYSSTMANNKGRPYHCGIDLVSSNLTIRAAASGTVKYRGYSSGNGYHVVLSHNFNGKTVYTLYSHLSSYSDCPAVGKTVAKGAKIGVMGNTGNSFGTHLHFAIFSGTYSSDPLGYIKYGGSNKVTYNGTTFYNPNYVLTYGKLP